MIEDNITYKELTYWLILHHAPRISDRVWQRLLTKFPSIEAFCKQSAASLKSLGFQDNTIHAIHKPNKEAVKLALTWHQQPNQHIICFSSLLYPKQLQHIPDPPPLLYVRGDLGCLNNKQIAIVGSRHPTPAGIDLAYDFADILAQQGLTITSGLALGIDAASHQGALHNNGTTIAVLANGLSKIYPARHKVLADKICRQGAILSEMPLSTPPLPKFFPKRNRIISGLSLGVLVVEANLRSGSLITTKCAIDQGRDVFAIPHSPYKALGKGPNFLIQQGAKLVTSCNDILAEIPSIQPASIPLPTQSLDTDLNAPLEERDYKLIQCIEFEPTSFDLILSRCGFSITEATVKLLMLELNGYIKTFSGGYMRIK